MKTLQGQRNPAKRPAKANPQKKQTIQVRLRRWQTLLNLVKNWDAIHRIQEEKFKYHLPKQGSLADYIAKYYVPDKLPTADDIAKALFHQGFKACGRTVRTDIKNIQDYWGSDTIGYDEQAHGYCLGEKKDFAPVPLLSTSGMQAAIMCQTMMAPLLPLYLQAEIEGATQIEHAMINPKDFNADAANAFALAPSPQIHRRGFNQIFPVVMDACKQARQLDITYTNRKGDVSHHRIIDPHALFISEGAWYVRAYCHLRKIVISMAIHRMESPVILDTTFKRDPRIADEVRAGKCFDYKTITDIVLEVSKAQAKSIGDRNWFCQEPGGEQKRELADKRLEIKIRWAYEPPLIRWILGYGGAVVVKQPLELRQEIWEAAKKIVDAHKL